MSSPPPSLRVYTLAKRLPGLFSATDLLEEDGQLLVELTVYAGEEARVANEEAKRAERETRKPASGKGGRFRRRRR